jgi:hypothetical protein
VLALAVVAILGAAGLAFAIPNCWEICDYGTGYIACYYDNGCIGASEVCISGQGYCQFTCRDGAVYYMICHKNCGGGGGSPVFKKPIPIEQEPNP